jgi:EAL domain-containing protein (putative c-di-GMP-specific phosphodiesterase class I)
VLETACLQNVAWRRQGMPPVRVAVNLSARQFNDEHLLDDVKAILERTGMDPAALELEITESMLMHNVEKAIRTLNMLIDAGVRIAMDDFGTGYSSLNYLKRFPIDRVKLDRSFVRDVVANPEDAAIVRAVISMAHTLRLVVVAEGVENEEQLAFLRQHRCDEMQGYLFSPPVAPEEFRELLTRRQPLPAIA